MLPERRIEFIGNSITCGYGVESENPSDPFTYETENHFIHMQPVRQEH